MLGAAARVNLELPDGRLPFTILSGAGAGRLARKLAVEHVVDAAARAIGRDCCSRTSRATRIPTTSWWGRSSSRRATSPGSAAGRRGDAAAAPPPAAPSSVLRARAARAEPRRRRLRRATTRSSRRSAATARSCMIRAQGAADGVARPDFLERREASRDRFFGAQAGVAYAEPFSVIGPPKITDPFCLLPESG